MATLTAVVVAESRIALRRLLAHRWPVVAAAARALRPELETVVAGGAADALMVRALAPMIGWRTADLFVVAGLDVPQDLVPATGTKPWHVGSVLERAVKPAPQSLRRLHERLSSRYPSIRPRGRR